MQRSSLIRRPFAYRYYNVTLILLALNVLIFIAQYLIPGATSYLGLIPYIVLSRGYIWQVVTYMFVHGSYLHILFNMLGLFIFGMQLERQMGSSEFLFYYLFAGIGTGIVSLVFGMNVIGASGAVYALLLAFATYFPRTRLLVFYVLPLPAPLAVAIFTVMSLIFQFTGIMGGVSHIGHLAGIVLGFLYFIVRLGINPIRVFLGKE